MLKSPSEDFVSNTLSAVPGAFGKLQYVAGLRNGPNEYFHWGMARSHGEGTASLAIARAHADVFGEILRAPMNLLWEEVREAALSMGSGTEEFIQGLMERKDALVPADLKGGSRRHFNSVLLGLSGLAVSSGESRTDPGA